MINSSNIKNYLTIDVEDYYHVSAFANVIRFEDWDNYESRVVNNTRKILEILSEAGEIKGTFFILGWVVEKHPEIVKDKELTLCPYSKGFGVSSAERCGKTVYKVTISIQKKQEIVGL